MLVGTIIDCIFMYLSTAFFAVQSDNLATLFLICNIFSFSATINVTYITYMAEITSDISLGVAECVIMMVNLINASATLWIVSALDWGYLFFYGTMALISIFFITCFIKETKGLADIERKELYRPMNLEDSEIEHDPDELKPRFTNILDADQSQNEGD